MRSCFVSFLFPLILLLWVAQTGKSDYIVGTSGPSLYSINPSSGAVTTLGGAAGVQAIGSSFVPYTFFVDTPNIYLESYPQSALVNGPWACPTCSPYFISDIVYDPASNTLFGFMQGGAESIVSALTDTGPISGLTSFPLSQSLVLSGFRFSVPFGDSAYMAYINGLGMYVTDGTGAYWLNVSTDTVTHMPSPNLSGVTGLVYDPDDGKVVVAAGNAISDIDPLTGQITVLNNNAPAMNGIALVDTSPEPSTFLLMACGLLCLAAFAICRKHA